jgi:RNA polymerase I-specific transcription initiation factor RRN7
MDLMLGYKENHGLVFPAIPAPPLLFLYVRDMALPRTLNLPQNGRWFSN